MNEPGAVMEYNDIRVNVLAYSLTHVWRKPLPMVLKEKIMDPIVASTTWRWFGYDDTWTVIDRLKMSSVTGGGHSGGGIFINTEGNRHWKQLSENIFYAAGFGGNFVVIDREKHLVVVIRWLEPSKICILMQNIYAVMP